MAQLSEQAGRGTEQNGARVVVSFVLWSHSRLLVSMFPNVHFPEDVGTLHSCREIISNISIKIAIAVLARIKQICLKREGLTHTRTTRLKL